MGFLTKKEKTQPKRFTRLFLKSSNGVEAVIETKSIERDGRYIKVPCVIIGRYSGSDWPLDEFDDLVAFVAEQERQHNPDFQVVDDEETSESDKMKLPELEESKND